MSLTIKPTTFKCSFSYWFKPDETQDFYQQRTVFKATSHLHKCPDGIQYLVYLQANGAERHVPMANLIYYEENNDHMN